MGGFSVPSGRGWRYQFDAALDIQNNAIEFLASVVEIWLDILNKVIPPFGSILAITDNTSCVCWLKKSSFDNATKPFESKIACHLALLVINQNIQLHSQHLAGLTNKLTDALSRKFDYDDYDLTRLALSTYPDQVPVHFRIYPVPPEVSSWISSTLTLLTPPSTNEPSPPTRNRTSPGSVGKNTYIASESATMPSWTATHTSNGQQLEQASSKPSGSALSAPHDPRPLAEVIRSTFSEGLLEIPLDTWRRNSGVISGLARFTNSNDKTFSLTTCRDSSEHGQTVTRPCEITPKHLRYLHLYATQINSPIHQALATLVTAAFFFACRSCEYLRVVVRGKTKILCISNIVFTTSDYTVINHHDTNLLTKAAYVSVIFEDQKNNHKFEKRTQQRSSDPILCPVQSWAQTVTRILSYPGTTLNTTVNCFRDSQSPKAPTVFFSQQLLNYYLRHTVQQRPAGYFGYSHTNIGTHSIRSGAAMALYLADEPPHKIMLLGRWSSDAFLLYLRPEVLSSFSKLRTNMLANEDFRHATQPATTDTIHPEETLLRHDTRSLIGNNTSTFYVADKVRGDAFPRFHLFH
jgi:hypothetical protein